MGDEDVRFGWLAWNSSSLDVQPMEIFCCIVGLGCDFTTSSLLIDLWTWGGLCFLLSLGMVFGVCCFFGST